MPLIALKRASAIFVLFGFLSFAAGASGPPSKADEWDLQVALADLAMRGIVVGIPFGGREYGSAEIGRSVAQRNGFGLVIARIPKPYRVYYPGQKRESGRGIVYTEASRSAFNAFQAGLKKASLVEKPEHQFIFLVTRRKKHPGIDVYTLGYSKAERGDLRRKYNELAGRLPEGVKRWPLLFKKDDRVKYRYQQFANYGLATVADRTLTMLLPGLTEDSLKPYRNLLAELTAWAAKKFPPNPGVEVAAIENSVPLRMAVLPGTNGGAIVAAPHGRDFLSDRFAEAIATRLNLKGLIVHGGFAFRDEKIVRLNVNRPTEGLGRRSHDEDETAEAASAYTSFSTKLRMIAGSWPPPLYVEVHSNGRREFRGEIQVATVGISSGQATALRAAYKQALDATGIERKFRMLIEPTNIVGFSATSSKTKGVLSQVKNALHIEVPVGSLISAKDNGLGNPSLEAHITAVTAMVKKALDLGIGRP